MSLYGSPAFLYVPKDPDAATCKFQRHLIKLVCKVGHQHRTGVFTEGHAKHLTQRSTERRVYRKDWSSDTALITGCHTPLPLAMHHRSISRLEHRHFTPVWPGRCRGGSSDSWVFIKCLSPLSTCPNTTSSPDDTRTSEPYISAPTCTPIFTGAMIFIRPATVHPERFDTAAPTC